MSNEAEVSQFCEKRELLSKIQEIESQLRLEKAAARILCRLSEILERKLAESVPKSELVECLDFFDDKQINYHSDDFIEDVRNLLTPPVKENR